MYTRPGSMRVRSTKVAFTALAHKLLGDVGLSLVLGRPMVLRVMEDNTTCIGSVEKGYSPAMRYLPRTQRTSLGFLHEVFCELDDAEIGAAILQYANTKKHKGDFFTKDSLSAEEFNAALKSLRIHTKSFVSASSWLPIKRPAGNATNK